MEQIKTASLQGGVVILGRGANYLLGGSPAYRIRVVAPLETRIRNLMDSIGMSENQAREEIRTIDHDRAQFVKRYFQKNIDDPTEYE